LREITVQRKITGTLRNERGTRIMQILMSVIGTWRLQGLNTYEMLLKTIRS
ncbi:IS66 family transposase, partial [Candidatus Woesearchaeota archaeon]|nr:IS66 family transposase [Candidatus Woesearchaeota archaeon]